MRASVAHTVAGIDACSGGWLVVVASGTSPRMAWAPYVAGTISGAMLLAANASVTAVDLPIGLSDQGQRLCDVEARRLLGERASWVCAAPARAVLSVTPFTYATANQLSLTHSGKRIAKQTWPLLAKIREVDRWMTPSAQNRVVEVHPELSFWALNGRVTIADSKYSIAGRLRRQALLQAVFAGFTTPAVLRHPNLAIRSGVMVEPDDINDAFVATWTAYQCSRNLSVQIPSQTQVDSRGLRMEMHY